MFLEAADVCWRAGLIKLLSPVYKLEKKVNWIFEHVSSLLQDVCSVLREMKERSNGQKVQLASFQALRLL